MFKAWKRKLPMTDGKWDPGRGVKTRYSVTKGGNRGFLRILPVTKGVTKARQEALRECRVLSEKCRVQI